MKNIVKILIAIALVICMLSVLISCGGDDIYKDPSAAVPDTEDEEGEENNGTQNGGTHDQNNGSGNIGIGENSDAPGDNWAPVRPA